MGKAGERILEGAREALAIAQGAQPSASITLAGIKYVPDIGWQPIESAPKDGTPILGYNAGYPHIARIAVLVWFPDEWRVGDSWTGSAINMWMPDPTHWMPLPPPPSDIGR